MTTARNQFEMSEADFQRRLIETAKWLGWKAVHYRPARMGSGRFATPLTGDKGAPDLLLARGGVVLVPELKRDSGRPTTEQKEWLAELGTHGRLWRPRDWAEIEQELR